MDIYNASSTLPPEDLLSFTKLPHRVVLQPGENLYRFISIKGRDSEGVRAFKGNHVFASPWWIPGTTYRQITKAAHRTGQSIGDVARSGLAIAYPWNPAMDWLTILELSKPVYGWIGPAKPQGVWGSGSPATFLGNRNQIYVPNLAPEDAMTSDAARLAYVGNAWSQY
jgi:hypothetical protein